MIPGGRRGRQGVRPALLRAPAARPAELAQDRARALALTPVSRETAARLDRFVALLLDWQRRVNLIAPSTEPALWTRHIADSLQLLALAPASASLGRPRLRRRLPGAVDRLRAGGNARSARPPGREQHQESCLFARGGPAAGAPAVVHAMQIADFVKKPPERIDVVTARAVAPLVRAYWRRHIRC